ncbi:MULTISPECIES: GtrA family protein [Paludibacter]|jgi:putative flippase GtrA|nr:MULTISPECIES: GtrA family protein [Paludibacter]MDP4201873.1 GtrA family protein [Bacteroidota bacterium]MTK54486.1 GtrA family protein [Paludibacter sp.]
MLAQFVKFCVVGASGTVIDFGLTYLFKEKVHLNKYISNSIGFLSAATSNYILNRIWSFENHNPAIGEQYMLFMSISLLGLLINNGVIYLLTKKLHMNFYVAKVIATGVVTLWNFVMNYLFTFR